MEKTELLACPFCGEVPRHGYGCGATWHENGIDNRVYISCSSDAHDGMCLHVYGDTFEAAAKCWNRRTPPPDNKPLTVGDMVNDGRPVWVEHLNWVTRKSGGFGCYGIPNKASTGVLMSSRTVAHYCDYGKTWLAYRRPPEKGE